MKKTFLITIFLLNFISLSLGQSQDLSSLVDSLQVYNYYQPKKAIPFLHQILSIYEKNENWEYYVTSLSQVAANYYYLKDYEKTLAYLDTTVIESDKHKFPKNSYLNSSIWNIRGAIANEKGNSEQALNYFKQSLAIDTTLSNISPQTLSYGYNNIGRIYDTQGDFQQAIFYYKHAISYQEKDPSKEVINYINLYNNIGYSFYNLKKYKKAQEYYDKAIIHINNSNGNKAGLYKYINSIYTNIALNYKATSEFGKAVLYLNKVLKIAHLKTEDKARVYKHIGTTLYQQGKYTQALDTLKVALELRKKEYSSKNYIISITHQAIGDVYSAQKNYSKALNSYQKAIQSVVYDFNDNNIKANPKLNKALNNVELLKSLTAKAKTLQLQNKHQLALETYQLCTQLIDQMRISYQHEGSKLFLVEQGMDIYEQAIATAILLDKKELAYELAEKSKSILLLEATRGIEARFGLSDELLEKEKSYKVDIAYYERQIWNEEQKGTTANQEQIKKWRNIIFEVKEKYSQLKEQFQKEYPDYFQVQYNSQVSTMKEIQRKLLNKKTAIISYFLGKEKVYIFTITKKGIETVAIAITDELNNKVFTLRNFLRRDKTLNNPHTIYYSTSFQLYQQFLAPALRSLPKSIQQLVIIPDGELNYIPFEILLTAQPLFNKPRYEINKVPYLIRDFQISYAYSATLLLEGQKRKNKDGLKTFGGFVPKFNQETSPSRGCDGDILGNLPFGRENILTINQIMDGNLHFDEEANLDNFKKEAEQYKILHLCTHACAKMDLKDTRIYFTDGELLAFELLGVPLNAELAVLSACETGIGEYKQGEGVMSLARAFMHSGCPSVLTSLWSVDDKSTSEVMQHFYKNLKKGMPKNKALHQAKLDYLDGSGVDASHPYYWSGFIQIGNTDALFKNKASQSTWWIWLTLVLVLVIGVYFWKRK